MTNYSFSVWKSISGGTVMWSRVAICLVCIAFSSRGFATDAISGPSPEQAAAAIQQIEALRQRGQVVVNPALGAVDPKIVRTSHPYGSTNPPREGWDEMKKLFSSSSSKTSTVVNGVKVGDTTAPVTEPRTQAQPPMTPQQVEALQLLVALKAQQARSQGVLELGEDQKIASPGKEQDKSGNSMNFMKDPMDKLPPTETSLMRGAALAATALDEGHQRPSSQEKANMVDKLAAYTKKGFGSFLEKKNGKVLKFGFYRLGGVQSESTSSKIHKESMNVERPAAAVAQTKAMLGGAIDNLPLPAGVKGAIKQASSGESGDMDSLMRQAQLQAITKAQAELAPHLNNINLGQMSNMAGNIGAATLPLARAVDDGAPGAKLMAAVQNASGGVDAGKVLALKALQKEDGSINAELLGVVETAVDPTTGQLDPQKIQDLVAKGKLPLGVAQSLMTASAMLGK